MRIAPALCLALAACVEAEHITPVAQAVARADGVSVPPPLPLCDALPAVSLARNIAVLGTGFVPEVLAGTFTPPKIDVAGPTPRSWSLSNLTLDQPTNAGRFDVTVIGDLKPTNTLYSVVVQSPDGSETSTLANAIQLLPAPTVTSSSPATICPSKPTTVVFSGGTFTAPVKASSPFIGTLPPSAVHVDSSTQVTVAFPPEKTPGYGTTFDVVLEDAAGCKASFSLTRSCP